MPTKAPIGTPIPDTPHAVSVSLPTWQANVGYEEGDPSVVNLMQGGYPRFVFHPYVKQLITFCLQRFATQTESCLVFNSRLSCEECRNFMLKNRIDDNPVIRIAELSITPNFISTKHSEWNFQNGYLHSVIYTLLFPLNLASLGKQFWQHTGNGVSSRYAEHCLRLLEAIPKSRAVLSDSNTGRSRFHTKLDEKIDTNALQKAFVEKESSFHIEERYGRNLDVRYTDHAISILKKRISGVLGDASCSSDLLENEVFQLTLKEKDENNECDNIFLYPTGMTAIYNALKMANSVKPGLKTVQFGFPYIDTLKLQQKFSPGCHFFGSGDYKDLETLKKLLETTQISCLICEFPSNPLLKSPPLETLWSLANRYNFILIVDETVGNPVNISILSHTHLIVSSLTKIFSGDSNVMAGSICINPNSSIYGFLKDWMDKNYTNNLWCEDVIFLERNSRTFISRIKRINKTARLLCDTLKSHPKVKQIYYPKYDSDLYDRFSAAPDSYGGLFSIVLGSEEESIKFYDNLDVCKGPSLGTNFTLASPYVILAHYTELDWAEQFGIKRFLIRVSVGLEAAEDLIKVFMDALNF